MADKSKQQGQGAATGAGTDRPAAESLDREPRDEETREGHDMHVDRENEPRGRPTSDRFHTEQAHTDTDKKDEAEQRR